MEEILNNRNKKSRPIIRCCQISIVVATLLIMLISIYSMMMTQTIAKLVNQFRPNTISQLNLSKQTNIMPLLEIRPISKIDPAIYDVLDTNQNLDYQKLKKYIKLMISYKHNQQKNDDYELQQCQKNNKHSQLIINYGMDQDRLLCPELKDINQKANEDNYFYGIIIKQCEENCVSETLIEGLLKLVEVKIWMVQDQYQGNWKYQTIVGVKNRLQLRFSQYLYQEQYVRSNVIDGQGMFISSSSQQFYDLSYPFITTYDKNVTIINQQSQPTTSPHGHGHGHGHIKDGDSISGGQQQNVHILFGRYLYLSSQIQRYEVDRWQYDYQLIRLFCLLVCIVILAVQLYRSVKYHLQVSEVVYLYVNRYSNDDETSYVSILLDCWGSNKTVSRCRKEINRQFGIYSMIDKFYFIYSGRREMEILRKKGQFGYMEYDMFQDSEDNYQQSNDQITNINNNNSVTTNRNGQNLNKNPTSQSQVISSNYINNPNQPYQSTRQFQQSNNNPNYQTNPILQRNGYLNQDRNINDFNEINVHDSNSELNLHNPFQKQRPIKKSFINNQYIPMFVNKFQKKQNDKVNI